MFLICLCAQLDQAGKTTHITGFNDPNISDSLAIIDLVDAIKKGTINYSLVKLGHTQQVLFTFYFFAGHSADKFIFFRNIRTVFLYSDVTALFVTLNSVIFYLSLSVAL